MTVPILILIPAVRRDDRVSAAVDLYGPSDDLRAADHGALLPAAATAGAQVRATWARLVDGEAGLSALEGQRPRALVILTDGRASHDARIAAALLGVDCPAPVLVCSSLPGWIGALDVVVVLESGSPTESAAAAIAYRRGATVLVRGAARGDLADSIPGRVHTPPIGVPEALAGPGRLTFLLAVASACGLLRPSLTGSDVDTIADLLDLESVACSPQTDAFINPAVSLAQQLTDSDLVIAGTDPIAEQLGRHTAGVAAELAGTMAHAAGAAEIAAGAGLMRRLTRHRDIFADPFDDDEGSRSPLRPLLLRVATPDDPRQATQASAVWRSLTSSLPTAVALDGTELSLAVNDTGVPGAPDAAEPTGWVRAWAATALVMLRLDFAAVYLGLAAGQVSPYDGPAGLGVHDGSRQNLRPDTVASSDHHEEDVEQWS